MKIGLIGDIHAENNTLVKIVAFLKENDIQQTYCVGDVVDGNGSSNECCNILISEKIQTVRGNHDRWIFEGNDDLTPLNSLTPSSIKFLKNLPPTIKIDTPLGIVLLCHGLGKHDMASVGLDDQGYALEMNFELQELLEDTSLSFIINGHTHSKMIRKFETLTIINIGTIKAEHAPCFAILDCIKKTVDFYDIGTNGDINFSESYPLKT